jgi:hypothetical protein
MDYPIQHQEMGLWCWAAVALSVDTFFNPATPRTQCSVATDVQRIVCCPRNESCNEAAYLEDALGSRSIRRLAGQPVGRVTFEEIRRELRNRRPVCVRVAWRSGGAHFLVISGYHINAGEQFVELSDSIYGYSTYRFQRFADAYRGIGSWTNTYYVR